MRIGLFRNAIIVGAALLAAACMPRYKPPTASDPHAVLKLRRTYDSIPGPMLSELLMLEDTLAFQSNDSSRLASAAKTDAILVHPQATTLTAHSKFYHQETRRVQRTYYDTESYSDTESYNCGTGTHYQTCTRSVMRQRSVPRTRWVDEIVDVVDGACSRSLRLAPVTGHVYLIQYTYQDHGACTLVCYEQRATTDGGVSQAPCPSAPP
jgi:hypothetical protein